MNGRKRIAAKSAPALAANATTISTPSRTVIARPRSAMAANGMSAAKGTTSSGGIIAHRPTTTSAAASCAGRPVSASSL